MDTKTDMGSGSWKVVYGQPPGPIKVIVNEFFFRPLEPTTYNYVVHTPVVIVPINKTSAFVLSEWDNDGEIGLSIHDLRLVEDEMVGSISFNLRGSQLQIKKFKFEMLRVADSSNCVGIGFFFRKLFYNGFNTIMCPKILKSKPNSSLRAGIAMVQSSIDKSTLLVDEVGDGE